MSAEDNVLKQRHAPAEGNVLYIYLKVVDVGFSLFHRTFFNSIIDKQQHMHFFIQHYISLEC